MKTSAQVCLLSVLVISCTVFIYAQETLWEGLTNKVIVLNRQGRYLEAAKVAEEPLIVAENTFGLNHPSVATVCENMAELYGQIGKDDAAERLKERASKIRSKR